MGAITSPRAIEFIMDEKARGGIALVTFTNTDKTFTEKYVRALIHKEFKERLCDTHGGIVPTLNHLKSEFDGERATYYCAYRLNIKEAEL